MQYSSLKKEVGYGRVEMGRGRLVWLRSLVILVLGVVPALGSRTHVDLSPLWDEERALRNPGKGWYHHILDNGIDRYHVSAPSVLEEFPGMDHIYIRLAWSYLEPEEGRFDWSRIDTLVEEYVPRGLGVAFRITSKERGGYPERVGQVVDGVHYGAPYWVRAAGAAGVVVDEVPGRSARAWVPKWDDPIYLKKLENFHRAFAERYDAQPWMRYVDVGSIGDYGEGHTHPSTGIPPTAEEIKANIEVHLRNYKHTQIVVTDDLLYWRKPEAVVAELYEWVVARGITLRDDSPMVRYYLERYPGTGSVSHPHFYEPLFRSRPIVFELQHYGGVKRDGNWRGIDGQGIIPEFGRSAADIFKHALRELRASYIGYHGYAEEFLADNPRLAIELLNLSGYWLFPVSAGFPSTLAARSNTIEIEWRNRGVAPPYRDFDVMLRFRPIGGGIPVDLSAGCVSSRQWQPGTTVASSIAFDLPHGLSSGEYSISVRLESGGVPVRSAVRIEREDEDGFFDLGRVRVR
jgi:hypothetical protein